MASFKKRYIPFKFLKDKFLYFDPHNPLENDNTTRNAIQANNLDIAQYIQDAIDKNIITLPSNPGQGNTSLSYYDAGEGFWVYANEGIEVTRINAGEYTVSIPEDKSIIFLQKLFTNNTTETNGSGSVLITIDYNTTDYHTSRTNARYATPFFIWDNGEQYQPSATGNPSAIGITATQSTPSGGSNLLTLTNVSGAVDPQELTLKLTF